MGRRTQVDPSAYVRAIIDANPNMLVPHYLMHSYLYYGEDAAVITDQLYDEICNRLHARWDEVTHMHKGLIDRGSLLAGTGYYLVLPERVRSAAWRMAKELTGG